MLPFQTPEDFSPKIPNILSRTVGGKDFGVRRQPKGDGALSSETAGLPKRRRASSFGGQVACHRTPEHCKRTGLFRCFYSIPDTGVFVVVFPEVADDFALRHPRGQSLNSDIYSGKGARPIF
jgi:hypothetical protein